MERWIGGYSAKGREGLGREDSRSEIGDSSRLGKITKEETVAEGVRIRFSE